MAEEKITVVDPETGKSVQITQEEARQITSGEVFVTSPEARADLIKQIEQQREKVVFITPVGEGGRRGESEVSTFSPSKGFRDVSPEEAEAFKQIEKEIRQSGQDVTKFQFKRRESPTETVLFAQRKQDEIEIKGQEAGSFKVDREKFRELEKRSGRGREALKMSLEKRPISEIFFPDARFFGQSTMLNRGEEPSTFKVDGERAKNILKPDKKAMGTLQSGLFSSPLSEKLAEAQERELQQTLSTGREKNMEKIWQATTFGKSTVGKALFAVSPEQFLGVKTLFEKNIAGAKGTEKYERFSKEFEERSIERSISFKTNLRGAVARDVLTAGITGGSIVLGGAPGIIGATTRVGLIPVIGISTLSRIPSARQGSVSAQADVALGSFALGSLTAPPLIGATVKIGRRGALMEEVGLGRIELPIKRTDTVRAKIEIGTGRLLKRMDFTKEQPKLIGFGEEKTAGFDLYEAGKSGRTVKPRITIIEEGGGGMKVSQKFGDVLERKMSFPTSGIKKVVEPSPIKQTEALGISAKVISRGDVVKRTSLSGGDILPSLATREALAERMAPFISKTVFNKTSKSKLPILKNLPSFGRKIEAIGGKVERLGGKTSRLTNIFPFTERTGRGLSALGRSIRLRSTKITPEIKRSFIKSAVIKNRPFEKLYSERESEFMRIGRRRGDAGGKDILPPIGTINRKLRLLKGAREGVRTEEFGTFRFVKPKTKIRFDVIKGPWKKAGRNPLKDIRERLEPERGLEKKIFKFEAEQAGIPFPDDIPFSKRGMITRPVLNRGERVIRSFPMYENVGRAPRTFKFAPIVIAGRRNNFGISSSIPVNKSRVSAGALRLDSRMSTKQKNRARIGFSFKQRSNIMQRPVTKPVYTSGLRIMQTPKLTTTPKLILTPELIITPKLITPPSPIGGPSPFRFPRRLTLPNIGLGGREKRKKVSRVKLNRSFFFTPSVGGIGLKLKAPKIPESSLFGLSPRPIIARRKRKRR